MRYHSCKVQRRCENAGRVFLGNSLWELVLHSYKWEVT